MHQHYSSVRKICSGEILSWGWYGMARVSLTSLRLATLEKCNEYLGLLDRAPLEAKVLCHNLFFTSEQRKQPGT
jgi:hypothetical protein